MTMKLNQAFENPIFVFYAIYCLEVKNKIPETNCNESVYILQLQYQIKKPPIDMILGFFSIKIIKVLLNKILNIMHINQIIPKV